MRIVWRNSSSTSIVLRLSLYYGLLIALLLSVTSVLLYWSLSDELDRDDSQLLTTQVNAVRQVIENKNPDVNLRDRRLQLTLLDSRFQTRILDTTSREVIAQTSHMDVPVNAFPLTVGQPVTPSQWVSTQRSRFMLLSALVHSGDPVQQAFTVQVALSKAVDDHLLKRYFERLFVIFFLGTVGGTALGALIAKRSLKPLKKMSEVASRVTAQSLHERINPDRWPPELKLLAGSLDAMLRRLDESFNRMHQFSADLAHELRTPVHNLIGETEVALGRPRELSDYRVLLESNLEEFGRLTRMIDSMLFIARTDNKDFHIDFVSFDARKELESLKEFFDAMAEERRVTVHCVGNALAWGDPALFRRAVSNLLSNAMNVSSPGSSILMQVEDAGHETWVLVSDEGPGVALAKRDKIFDRFFRIDEARTHTTGGAGLGLAIVQSILQLHGGTVVLHQTSTKGSIFKLAFPAPAGNFAHVASLL